MKKLLMTVSAVSLLIVQNACTSFEDVKRQADLGNAEMQFKAAQMLFDGDGVDYDKQAAEKYLKAAFKARNLGAACYMIKSILSNPQGDESKVLMEAYDILFSAMPKNGSDAYNAVQMQWAYPEHIFTYMEYLESAGYGKSAFEFKKYAFKHLDKKKCHRRGRDISETVERLRATVTSFEIAEAQRLAEEKRLAEQKRIEAERRAAEEKRLAEQKRIEAERRAAEEKRLAEQKRIEQILVNGDYLHQNVQKTPQKLYKKFMSSASFKWFVFDLLKAKEKNGARMAVDCTQKWTLPQYDDMYYLWAQRIDEYSDTTFIFGLDDLPTEEKRVDGQQIVDSLRTLGYKAELPNACLTAVMMELPENIGFENVVAKYKKELANAKHSHNVKKDKDQMSYQGIEIDKNLFDTTDIFETDSLFVEITQSSWDFQLRKTKESIRNLSRMLENVYGVKSPKAVEELENMFNMYIAVALRPSKGKISIVIIDKKLGKYFEEKSKKHFAEMKQRKEQAAGKAKKDMIEKSLDF